MSHDPLKDTVIQQMFEPEYCNNKMLKGFEIDSFFNLTGDRRTKTKLLTLKFSQF